MASKKALSSKHGSRLAQYEPQIRQSIAKLVEIEQDTGLSIQQLRDICDQVAQGELKARRAKKKW